MSAELKLRSLAYLTDLSFIAFHGRVLDRGEYIVAETPDNHSFFWGNLLVMKEVPKLNCIKKWIKAFDDEFGESPMVEHCTFGWDSPEGEKGELKDFIAAGFEFELSEVLSLRSVEILVPRSSSLPLEIRKLSSDADWKAALNNQVACRDMIHELKDYLPYMRAKMKKYRAMTEAGHGHWYGAFANGELVADCGLFQFGNLGRFQSVSTHPDYRRLKVCSNLIYRVSQMGFEHGLETLIIVADPNYHASQIYRSVGFSLKEYQVGMCRRPLD
jgi:N-acetylglutamate synthase-like GNAT family acetyltransferase